MNPSYMAPATQPFLIARAFCAVSKWQSKRTAVTRYVFVKIATFSAKTARAKYYEVR
jgi:hypothetical protein